MGFSNDPALLIADEPTTALDVTVQAQILELLRQLNTELGTAILLISHNLGVIASVCSRIVVMYAGEVVEEGTTVDLLAAPKHPYTWALLNAAPRLDQPAPQDRHLTTIEGTPPDPMDWPTGCRFLDRCPFKIDQCRMHPPLASVGARRRARCWVTQGGQALPSLSGPGPAAGAAPAPAAASTLARERLLELRGLQKHFPVRGAGRGGRSGVVHALDGVDLDVYRGETVGLVGESGCGKSTLARLVLRLQRPTAGVIRFEGQDISQASDADMRPFRRRMQMVFQDPYASLNPRMRVGDTLAEPIRFHRLASGDRMIAARVEELLGLVGLPLQAAAKFPHEFSGGQRQRVAIARALAVQPDFIVADEPISSLDVNIQAQIINLLVDLQSRLGLTYLFIAHDLAVVRHISDRIVVLYLGKVAEIASSADLFDRPLHPYSRSLIASVPTLGSAAGRTPLGLRGEAPSVTDPPSGCRFRTRCPIAQPVCAAEVPLLQEHAPGQWASCHFPGKV
jgi:peptide/nickel transport system ATP-binding protein